MISIQDLLLITHPITAVFWIESTDVNDVVRVRELSIHKEDC
jgi:hypothetical protein